MGGHGTWEHVTHTNMVFAFRPLTDTACQRPVWGDSDQGAEAEAEASPNPRVCGTCHVQGHSVVTTGQRAGAASPLHEGRGQHRRKANDLPRPLGLLAGCPRITWQDVKEKSERQPGCLFRSGGVGAGGVGRSLGFGECTGQ